MEIKQISDLLNDVIMEEALGESALVKEDLSNLVDVGGTIEDKIGYDKYCAKLVNRIGREVFTIRKYSGAVPSILMDNWTYGSIVMKTTMELPETIENDSWKLSNGSSYDPHVFYAPSISQKFFNQMETWDLPMSFPEVQIQQSFTSAESMDRFISMIYQYIENALTLHLDELTLRVINNMIGETWYTEHGTELTQSVGVKAVNLLLKYNTINGTTLTKEEAMQNPAFIKFASYTIGLYSDRMARMSTLFNLNAKERFTPKDLQRLVLLSEFSNGAKAFLESDVYHNEFVKLPKHDIVTYWQGSGTDYDFASTSKIYVDTNDGTNTAQSRHTVQLSGIIGVLYDWEALGVTQLNKRVKTSYTPNAEFITNYYKTDVKYFNDFNENFVVFYLEDAPVGE